MDGIRTGKCIEMADNRIFQITGTFVNDTLQVRTTKNLNSSCLPKIEMQGTK